MRSSARRCGAACRVGVGWKRQLSSAFPPVPPAPPRLHPRLGTPPLLPLAWWRVSGVPIPPDLPATSPRCWVRRAQRAPTLLHAPLPVAPATTAFPLATDRRARILGSRLQGSGLTGGGSLPRGRVPVRRFPPLALDRSASAGRRLSAALGLPRGRQAPPHARPPGPSGLPPTPAPNHASCGCLSGSLALSAPAPLPLSCVPLPAWRHASRRSPPFPLPSVVVGGGCPGTRARVRGAPVDGVGGES